VPWPTDHWPRTELDGRVDRDLLDRTLDHAFTQPESLGTTSAVLIVHRGAIVVERYADDVDASATHVSWSMAKSMLHAVIGILSREGRIDVAAVADDPAWRAPGDPRGSITIDQLLKAAEDAERPSLQ
jgi:CubicO group peptidase (beta-lactamase class C family)